MIKLVILDFDGTLVDTALDIMEAANKLLIIYGHKPLTFDQIRAHIGDGFTPFIRSIADIKADDPKFTEEVFNKFQNIYDEQLMKNSFFYDGAEKFLKDYQRSSQSKIGIVSNKPEYQVRLILKELGIQESHLVEIFGGDRFEVKKPHPKPLIEMMNLAGVTPNETVMIGDSRADVEAAKAAATHFIAVSFGYNPMETLKQFGAENFIHHFDELLPLLQALGAQAG